MEIRPYKQACAAVMAALPLLLVLPSVLAQAPAHTPTASPERMSVVLGASEREFVLSEMRAFLGTVQTITEALSRNDTQTAGAAARKMGMADMKRAPASIMAKLPNEFRLLTRQAHGGFDNVAGAAEKGSMPETLRQLSTVLQTCNACHGAYQFRVE